MIVHLAPNGEWPPGYEIRPRGPDLDISKIDAFRVLPVAVVGDCMGRIVGGTGLRHYHGHDPVRLCGPALTVRVRPGDNLMIHKALAMAQAGDVIVIDGAGDVSQALVGGLMRVTALRLKLGGLIVDGAIRDVLEWAEGGIPIYARGHTHRGPSKDGPGAINIPIACAGLAVQPGDLMIADADGLVAIPSMDVDTVLARAQLHLAQEKVIRDRNALGEVDPRIDAILREKGLPI